jgi:hypothetical protein
MDQAIIDEILEELSSTLQRVEAQSAAILEFVKEKGMVKEDELAPFLERANAASSVRWRATRVRLQRLLSGLEQKQQQQLDEERKRVEAKHETGENNAGETDGQKAVAKPEAQTGKPQREEEKHEVGQSIQPRESDQKHGTTQPNQPAHTGSANDSAARSAEQPPDKSQQSDAA